MFDLGTFMGFQVGDILLANVLIAICVVIMLTYRK